MVETSCNQLLLILLRICSRSIFPILYVSVWSSVQVYVCVCRVISQRVAVVQFECMLVCIQESSQCSLVIE